MGDSNIWRTPFHAAQWGAMGFGASLTLALAIFVLVIPNNTGLGITAGHAISVGIGAAALATAIKKSREQVILFALTGFIAGGLADIVTTNLALAADEWAYSFVNFIRGGLIGASLGILQKGWKQVGVLALAGALGFGLAYFPEVFLFDAMELPIGRLLNVMHVGDIGQIQTALMLAVAGAAGGMISGAFLGFGLGWLT